MGFVRDTPQGLQFPKNIPRQRSKISKYAIITTSATLQVLGCLFSKENILCYLTTAFSTTFLTMGLVELISKFCHLYEELKHIESRHKNSLQQLLLYVFTIKPSKSIILVLSLLALIIVYIFVRRNPLAIVLDNSISTMLVLFSTLLLNQEFNFEDSLLNKSRSIGELKGLDYGSGMAHSFFHGYLRIVLPNNGTSEKGLLEFLQDYEARHGVKFDIHKLFILIPMSQFCPPRLDSDFSVSIEQSDELECKEIDRSGVSKRNYKNSVYKIVTQGDKKKYVAAEYATPIKTLHEVMNQNTPISNLYKQHRQDLILNFYLTLKKLIKDDPDCCNLCELIYYDDKEENEEDSYRDVGGIILKRMGQMLKKKK